MNTTGVLVLLLFAAAIPLAHSQPKELPSSQHVKASLICETTTIQPNSTVHIGVLFQIEKGWHIYWDGQNDSGMPPRFHMMLPDGCTPGEWLWPAPKRHISPGDVLDHVYENEVLLILPIRVGTNVKPGEKIAFRIEADWLVCQHMCIPESAKLELEVPITNDRTKPGNHSKYFEIARTTIPKAWPLGLGHAAVWRGNEITIRGKNAESVAFFPSKSCPEIDNLLKRGQTKGDSISLHFPKMGELPAPQQRVTGVVELRFKGVKQPVYYSVDFLRPPGGG